MMGKLKKIVYYVDMQMKEVIGNDGYCVHGLDMTGIILIVGSVIVNDVLGGDIGMINMENEIENRIKQLKSIKYIIRKGVSLDNEESDIITELLDKEIKNLTN